MEWNAITGDVFGTHALFSRESGKHGTRIGAERHSLRAGPCCWTRRVGREGGRGRLTGPQDRFGAMYERRSNEIRFLFGV